MARSSRVGKMDVGQVFPRRSVMSRRSLRRSQEWEERRKELRWKGKGKILEDTLAPPHPAYYLVSHKLHVNDINLRLGTLCLSHKPSGDLIVRGCNGRLAAHRALCGAAWPTTASHSLHTRFYCNALFSIT